MKEFDNYRDIIVDYWFSKKYMEWMMNGNKYDQEITEKFQLALIHLTINWLFVQ